MKAAMDWPRTFTWILACLLIDIPGLECSSVHDVRQYKEQSDSGFERQLGKTKARAAAPPLLCEVEKARALTLCARSVHRRFRFLPPTATNHRLRSFKFSYKRRAQRSAQQTDDDEPTGLRINTCQRTPGTSALFST